MNPVIAKREHFPFLKPKRATDDLKTMRLLKPTVVIFAGILSAMLFFRLSVITGFDRILGNGGDGCLIFGIVDHWRDVFSGNAKWDTLPMFWPATGTLGFSDAFFINGVVHSVLCALGIDIYYSYSITLMLQALAGYFLMYMLLRRFMNIRWPIVVAISAIFVNLSAIQTAGTHIQMHSVWLCPGIMMLGWKALENRRGAAIWAALCGLSLAALFFTVYYVSWFFTFVMCLCACIWIVAKIRRGIFEGNGIKPALKNVIATICARRAPLVAFAAAFAVGIIPFLLLYIPVMRQSGAWPYDGLHNMMPGVVDLVNTGSANILWGWMSGAMNLEARENFWELSYGVAPITMLMFIAAMAFLVLRLRRGAKDTVDKIALVFGISVVICWALVVKVDGCSLWIIVFHLVPGAGALRALFRFDVVLSFFVLIVIAVFFDRIAAMKKTPAIVSLCAILAVMFAEQFSMSKANDQISRRKLVAFDESIPAPPTDARVFYMAPSSLDRVSMQIAAFSIARRTGIPTLNGYSGTWPAEWHLLDIDRPNYEELVRSWIRHTDVPGLYRFDLDAMTWTKMDCDADVPKYQIGSDVVRDDILDVYGEGWTGREYLGGAWSCAKKAFIALPLEKPAPASLRVHIDMNGYVPVEHRFQRVRIFANGVQIAELKLTQSMLEQVVDEKLPEACIGAGKLVFEFDLPNAKSPASYGLGDDERRLGLCLFSFRVYDKNHTGK